jgi:hypothetical protein
VEKHQERNLPQMVRCCPTSENPVMTDAAMSEANWENLEAELARADAAGTGLYAFPCPTCRRGPYTVHHADLQQVRIGVLGMEWQCTECQGWTVVRVREADRGLTVEKGAAPAVRA